MSVGKWTALDAETQKEVKEGLASLQMFRPEYEKKKKKKSGHLTAEQMELVAGCTEVTEFKFRELIQKEGEPVAATYIVLDGSLAKLHNTANGPELVEHIREGGQMGQLHMICSSDCASSTVLVDSEEARLVVLPKDGLDHLLDANPKLLRAICNNLALSVRDHVRRSQSTRLVRLVESLVHSDAYMMQAPPQSSATVQFIAAAISGVGSMTCGYPLDVVRTRLQSEGRGDLMYGLKIMTSIAETEGFGALFRGWGPSAVTHTVQNSAYHSAYGRLVTTFQDSSAKISDPLRLLFGVVAGCFAAFLVTPLTIITYKMQGKGGELSSPLSIIRDVIAKEGITGLWAGLGPSLVLAINPCITYYVFDDLKSRWLKSKNAAAAAKKEDGHDVPATKLTPLETLCLGALAKAVASTITFPLMMAKIRMSLFGREKYPSMYTTFQTVIHEEGFSGMFKGMGLSLVRSIYIAALEFALRDRVTDLVAKMLTKKKKPRVKPDIVNED
ncbi:Peroxisomal adenine nucleotide transporter 1 [Diplonema papillatum]|nr:Peroxisomal adenine nucleotide transporter 1 [Diplonema papillatum]